MDYQVLSVGEMDSILVEQIKELEARHFLLDLQITSGLDHELASLHTAQADVARRIAALFAYAQAWGEEHTNGEFAEEAQPELELDEE